MIRKVGSVLIAALVVLSAVSVGVGSVSGQTDDTASKTFTTGPHKILIDTSNVSSETTVEIITDESPAGDNTVIARKTVSGFYEEVHFRNAGAYETFTVKISGLSGSEVTFSKGGVLDAYTAGKDTSYFVGDTGGDPGFTYDLSEQISSATNPEINQLDAEGLPDSKTAEIDGLNAEQSKIEIYQSAQNSRAATDNTLTVIDNYLSDTKTQARIVGKNAYIRALNNGSSEAAATTAAKSAVAEYYTTKQVNLLAEWERHGVSTLEYLDSKAVADSEVGANYTTKNSISVNQDYVSEPYIYDVNYGTVGSYTLANGSSTSVEQIEYVIKHSGETGTAYAYADPTNGEPSDQTAWYSGGETQTITIHDHQIKAPNSNYEPMVYVDHGEYNSRLTEIENQNDQVQSEMDALVNGTYSEYQSGEIDNSDLVDPYQLSQTSSSEDFEGWTASTLTLLGVNSPSNFDQIGSFEVSTESGQNYTGIVYSQENPASGSFESGQTYDPSQIGGTQYITTADEIHELQSNFTITRIEQRDGTEVQNVTIRKVQYETTNVTELKQLYEDLAQQNAEIEARKAALSTGGTVDGITSGEAPTELYLILGGVAAAALLLGRSS